jgi:hypothetical protein
LSRSVHDNIILSYAVNCKARTITINTEFRDISPGELTDIIFADVLGYHLMHDAFGNIVFDIEESPLQSFLHENARELSDAFRQDGALGEWTQDPPGAFEFLNKKGIHAYRLVSSLGLCGWVLAKSVSIVPA